MSILGGGRVGSVTAAVSGRKTREQQQRESDVIRLRYSRRTGQPPTRAFYNACVRSKRSSVEWRNMRLRCIGEQDWDKEMGKFSLGSIPLLGTAISVATSFIPGGGLARQALGLLGGGGRQPAPAATSPAAGGMKLIGYYGRYPVVILTGLGG